MVTLGGPRRGLTAPVVAALCVLVVLLSGCGGAAPTGPGPGAGAAPGGDGSDDPAGAAPVTVSGNTILRAGRPWWFLGYNSFTWSGNCGTPQEMATTPQDVDAWFASMRSDGHGAVRLFFFEGWDVGRLDAAVESARRHRVSLVITLDDAIAECGESEKNAAWFADPGERAAYEQHMTMLLQRYRGDPTIAWFEYFNEPGYADGALRRFYDEMGAVADRVDPTRLFSSGTIAPYALGGEPNFLDVHRSPGVDIVSLHEYDENEIESNQGPRTRAASAGKPVVVGEFGIMAGPACTDFATRARRVEAKAQRYIGNGYVGALAWAWQPGETGACELGNLDADPATQAVLRDVGR